jgi:hypothetical protein
MICISILPDIYTNVSHDSLGPTKYGNVEVGAFGEVLFAERDVAQYWCIHYTAVIRHNDVRLIQIIRRLAIDGELPNAK